MRRATGRAADFLNMYDGPNGNKIFYLVGDAFNTVTYKMLRLKLVELIGPMTLVLSDGMHTGQAVKTEAERLVTLGIIQPEVGEHFSMIWDDCEGNIYEVVDSLLLP